MDIKNRIKGATQVVQRHLSLSMGAQQTDITSEMLTDIAGYTTTLPNEDNNNAVHKKPSISSRRTPKNDPDREQHVLESIGSIYYNDDPAFDINLYELQRLPAVLDSTQLNKDRKGKKEQLSVVNKKVSALIMHNHPSYAAELTKVTELKCSLTEAFVVCRLARRHILDSREQSSGIGLRLLAKHRKMAYLKQLYAALSTVKTLHQTDYRLRELLEEGNYSRAIDLCRECQAAAQTYKSFLCIGQLSDRLSCTLECIEQQLDAALPVLFLHFDVDHYVAVLQAYEMLDRTQSVTDRLLHAVEHCLLANCDRVLLSHLINPQIGSNCATPGPVDLLSLQADYAQHCKLITASELQECVGSMLALVWRVLHNLHLMLTHHIHQEEALTGIVINHQVDLTADSEDSPDGACRFRLSLERSLPRVWHMAVKQINTLLECVDFMELKFDAFMQVVVLITRFTQLGATSFLTSSTSPLDETLSRHAIGYFQRYHRARMDELKTFLEHEVWQPCPVSADFSVHKMQEFNWLTEFESRKDSLPSTTSPSATASSTDPTSYTLISADADNPFESSNLMSDSVNTSSSPSKLPNGSTVRHSTADSDDETDELHRDFVEEDAGYISHSVPTPQRSLSSNKPRKPYVPASQMAPIMCNTSVNILRLFGRYLHIMYTVPTIAFEVVTCLAQLFDLYYFAVCAYFGSDFVSHGVSLYTPRLGAALRRIEATSLVDDVQKSTLAHGGDSGVDLAGILIGAQLSSDVSRDSASDLYALAERVVAVESLLFVAAQLECVSDTVDRLVPASRRPFIQQFYTHTVYSTDDVRTCVYGCVATKAIDFQHLLTTVIKVNWSIAELMSQHNWYIDHLISDLHKFSSRLYAVHEKRLDVPKEVYDTLWSVVVHCVCRVLVEGYGTSGSKCTTEGRALMLLDLQQLISKLEGMCSLQPLPHTKLVDDYIKAYYLPESSILQWIRNHKDVYTVSQISTLLSVCPHISKKTKDAAIKQIQP